MTTTPAPLFTTPLQQALLGPQGASLQAATCRRLGQLRAQLHASMDAGLARDAFTATECLLRMLEQAQRVLDSLPCTHGLPNTPPAARPALPAMSPQRA